jgi:hypothetical protein
VDPDTVRKVRVGESVYVLAPQYVGLERDVAIESKKEMSCVTAAKLTLLLMLINVLFVMTVFIQSLCTVIVKILLMELTLG